MTISLIAAVARNGVIGHGGAIPWRIPGEQAYFKAITMGHARVMGRKTFDSIGRPLPGRTTVVITRDPEWATTAGAHPDILVATSISHAIDIAKKRGDVFVAGGGEIYRDTIGLADRLLISRIDAEPEGDATFPTIDYGIWECVKTDQFDGWMSADYRRRPTA